MMVTVGEGRTRPQGRVLELVKVDEVGPVRAVMEALQGQPRKVERWWSPHNWTNAYRQAAQWQSSIGVAVDLDYEPKEESPHPTLVLALDKMSREGKIPCSLFHMTPHGMRAIFIYDEPCKDRDLQIAASRGAANIIERALAAVDVFEYVVDAATWDLARFFYTPNAIAKGVPRNDEVILVGETPFKVSELATHAPPEEQPAQPAQPAPAPPKRDPEKTASIQDAIERWVADHPRDYPRHSSECPVCGSKESFGHLPSDDRRWFCFSTHHPDGCGIRGENGYHGDALDLAAWERGCKPIDILKRENYLPERRRTERRQEPTEEGAEGGEDGATPIRPIADDSFQAGSYLAAVTILRNNLKNVLGGHRLRWDEMAGRVILAETPIEDSHVSAIRALIEERITIRIGKQKVGMRIGSSDLHDAVLQVAKENAFHPVRDYLMTLEWDGVERIDSVADEILDAERSTLNMALMRRWFTSAVARAFEPGCKVDTVLILRGPQGRRKSTFFKTLAAPWFIDTAIDVTNKDAMMVLRRAWIIEWAELEALKRAREASAVKSFLTSSVDTYRPSYGRSVVDVPRSCVIVGTTNDPEFLIDDSGARRFWPLIVGVINQALAAEWRDQLWAEAVHLYRKHMETRHPLTGESPYQWWLMDDETDSLKAVHEEHTVKDPWEVRVGEWANAQVHLFTISEVLDKAVEKPRGQQTRADQLRVGAILRSLGYQKRRPDKHRPWVWETREQSH